MADNSFSFIRAHTGPRSHAVSASPRCAAPYYSTYGISYLADVLDVAEQWVDGVKWAGGSFALLPREQVRAFSDLAHQHDAYICSGGRLETVLRYGLGDPFGSVNARGYGGVCGFAREDNGGLTRR